MPSDLRALLVFDLLFRDQDFVNHNTWMMLPLEKQAELARLLPPEAFKSHLPTLDKSHPGRRSKSSHGSAVDSDDHLAATYDPEDLDPGIFTRPAFEAAAQALQVCRCERSFQGCIMLFNTDYPLKGPNLCRAQDGYPFESRGEV